jgi:antitoxin HicB
MAKHKNKGSSLDSFLQEEGILDKVTEVAVKRVVAFQIQEEMRKKNFTKTRLAREMKTSRSALNKLLDPDNDAGTIKTLHRAATVLGKKLEIRLA